jgi:ribosome modulation factor
MNLKWLAFPALAFFLAVAGFLPPKCTNAQQRPGYGQRNGDWDAPPPGMSEIEQRGYHDGIEGARKDFGNHRRPDVENRDEYRHPDVPRQAWQEYREAFRRGYERGMSYLAGANAGPAQGPGPGPGEYRRPDRDWNAYSGPMFEARRRGFADGMEGAIKDFGNHRRPDPDNRDEFRHPPVPGELADAYRDGFRRGYQVAATELSNGGADRDDPYREQGPRGEARMRGFQDGMNGAMHDFENHRRADPDNRDEFRHPDVPYPLQDAYRNGFERGYNVAMQGLMGLPPDRR